MYSTNDELKSELDRNCKYYLEKYYEIFMNKDKDFVYKNHFD